MKSYSGHKGFILIAVLWISLLLSIFALNMSTKSRLMGVQALNIENTTLHYQALYSGLARGYHEYRKYRNNLGVFESKDEWESFSGQELDLWFPRYEPYIIEMGDVEIGIRILNAHGKIDINKVGLSRLMEIAELCGAQYGVETTSVANSILDWIDEDDLTRAEGAEKDYYLGLADPYLPKNNTIQDIRELLMVRGITRERFYGTDDHPGLSDFFSTRGDDEMLDINSAPPETFAVLGDIPDSVVEDIIFKRSNKPISDMADLAEIVPFEYFDLLQQYFRVAEVRNVEIQAFIVLDDGSQGRTVSRIFSTGG